MQSEHDQAMISQLREEASLNADQIETLSNQCTLLDVDNKHIKQMLDSANVQVAKLKALLSTTSCDLSSTHEAKEKFQNQFEIVQQQLDNAASSLSHQVQSLIINL